MSRNSTNAISLCLIGAGMFAWAFAGRPLVTNPDLQVPLNPLGINGSPYGEVFAMAMQGPIDTYFHGAMGTHAHRHSEGDSCNACEAAADKKAKDEKAALAKSKGSSGFRFEDFLASLSKVETISTNPKAASDAHKRYLRRQTEDKLRFAYKLDPSHYGNYNSLNLFLTEPGVGTRPVLTPAVAKLAEDTIQYCLKQENDPRPALTAAAAASNVLQLMFDDQRNETPRFSVAQMRQFLGVLDYSMARFETLSKEWEKTKHWDLISPQRIAECEERYAFISEIREACEGTILRLEGNHQPQASN